MEKSIGAPEQICLQKLLRQVRKEAGLTQVALAARLATGQATISNYERGERRLDLVELRHVCTAIGIELREFIVRFEEVCQNAKEQEAPQAN